MRAGEGPETVAGHWKRPAALTDRGPLYQASGPDPATGCPGRCAWSLGTDLSAVGARPLAYFTLK